MATRTPYLTKSRYVQGITCEKLLWLGWHERLPYEEPEPGSPAAVGIAVGKHAHKLFPGGVAVTEEPWQHEAAVARTAELMADAAVPAIFEAAFTFDSVRIRADVIERLEDGRWGLREVKSSTRVKPDYVDDAAIQYHVMKSLGIDVASAELVHVNNQFVRGEGEIDWQAYFTRTDLTRDISAVLPEVVENVREQQGILARSEAPDVPASPHCPAECNYWARCTHGKPDDWIMQLPRLSQRKFDALHELGVERIRDVPEDFDLTEVQDRVRDVIVSGRDYVSPNLAAELEDIAEGALYLDFEAMSPAIPIYAGTRPYQRIVFQWSLHVMDADGSLSHSAFLADAGGDPRRAFAESLIEAVSGSDLPIVVYSAYEKGALEELARDFPDLAPSINPIVDRLYDLLAVIRDEIYLKAFKGSFSIKKVGPALVPSFGYDDLETVKDGAAAAVAFEKLAAGQVDGAEGQKIRDALLAYCERDTLAMVRVHDALAGMACRRRQAAE